MEVMTRSRDRLGKQGKGPLGPVKLLNETVSIKYTSKDALTELVENTWNWRESKDLRARYERLERA